LRERSACKEGKSCYVIHYFHCIRLNLVSLLYNHNHFQVFPALREWCENHRVSLVECDLRWGVPKDSTSSATIATCMEEIDRWLKWSPII
jgi:hypothetical protein